MKQEKPSIIVSACLLGKPCRYDGQSKPCAQIIALSQWAKLVPICPECDGGLPTPRIPSERQGEKVISCAGVDVTEAYQKGAKAALDTLRSHDAICAILKEKSPSCGTHAIYDGTFSGTLISGEGVAAEYLKKADVLVFSEDEIDEDWISQYLQ